MKLSVQEAASLLSTSDETVYDWIDEGSLPAQRIRGRYHVNRTELLEWATEKGLAVAPRLFRRATDAPGVPSIADAIRGGGIRRDVSAVNEPSLASAIAAAVPLADEGDRETLLRFLAVRPALGMAVAVDRIAVPSVRVPAVLSSSESFLTLFLLAKPFTMRFPEERTIDALFFLVCPTVHAHLAMIAKLSFCLRDERFRAAILQRAAADVIIRTAAAAEEET